MKWILVIILYSAALGVDEIITVTPIETEILCQEAAKKITQLQIGRGATIKASCLRVRQ